MNRSMRHIVISALALAACEPQANEPQDTGPAAGAYLAGTVPGVRVTPLATVGEPLPGSNERLAPTPDGIGVWSDDDGVMNLLLNHELSGVRRADGEIDYRFARVSRMRIAPPSARVLSHEFVIDGSEGYEVLCSATWVDDVEGFPRGYFFTGEERDYSGRQLAIEQSGAVLEMPWMGHYAHENQTVIPGFDSATVLLNFDDSSAQPERDGRGVSELYMFVGRDPEAVMSGNGQLYVFAPQQGESGNVGDLVVGDSAIGQWKPVPAEIARERDGRVLQSYVDSIGVFEFVRPEDGWYDKRPGEGPGAMFFDTGRDERVLNGARTGPADPWGSLYYVGFDRTDPAAGAVLTLLARSAGPDHGWASPDNGDMLPDGTIMLQEDPANSPWNRTPGIFRLRMTGPRMVTSGTMIARVTDPDCPSGPDCGEPLTDWETSGIVDASEYFGPGSWILSVQSHTKPVPSLGLAAEGGQLLLLQIDD
ncbi:MAG: PhoX family protein [Gemmatimonadota bacterium]|nr:PhoX family protein [Gemmatimonadota bacterium]